MEQSFSFCKSKGPFVMNAPVGTRINAATTMSYLGSTLREDGTIRHEICRRLGVGWADFSKMARLWRHTSLPRARKVQIFQAVVTSKVLYGLSSAWLNVCEQRRIDGFQARCLRSVLGIKPAYWSRVSNLKILEQACQRPYSKQLLCQQLLLYGKVARAADTDITRAATFCPGSLRPATDRYVRKHGRPRNEWATMLQKEALKMTGCWS